MDKYIFSAIFEPGETKGYCVTFPDLPGCITEGDTLEESLLMAKEALELHLYGLEEDNGDIPLATLPEKINSPDSSFIVPIEVYMPLVRNEMSNKAIKKTLTIPYWLNKIAEDKKVNFSQTLQVALKEQLGVQDYK
ncbi:toxin-antitoxin system HicB-like (endogenous virus) [Clostridium phage phiCTC2B]|uniref:Phage-related protein n=1 Tax=Clostridium tetani (strain Massachusetts / E88) TaxID=212717 RepID=Q892G4_CLOTE|nr:type II toxin-antitoxin system HicB family antitoxin [Clostridium tetani]YP_009276925.1 toxin-antitoxin system HicB-like [Clostridium phage phiCT19406B]YP_009277369.1 toxin-antitoxin system HicB-like [Clostridium phage phiCTC2B]AAO36631.1 phage-related protein [Clostridium tetani E88]AJA42785.1 pilus assembly protein HicB [Clostridium phage phiCT19406B]AJA42981.1 pilus assembly protein HicB [Clostridium phage phiCTC2B]SJZ75042.1 Predicted nuclease of the RNAse H fold, HicB family [Clostrid